MTQNNSQSRTRLKTPPSKRHTNQDESNKNADEDVNTCPECSGTVTADESRGEKSCDDCGLVIEEENIDHGPEWRAFNSQERDQKSRVGAPSDKMMHDKGLSTNIDWRDQDGYDRSLNANQRKRMSRLRKQNKRSKVQDAQDKNLREALSEINRMASALGIPKDVQEIASMLYRQCLNKDMLPGRSIEGMATACLYASARMENMPRSLDKMTQVSRVDNQEIRRAYRYINRELSLKIKPADPKEYLNQFLSELNVNGGNNETEKLARLLIDKIKDEGIHSGKSPTGIAAATIYMAGKLCNESLTQREIAEVSDVTEVTIRERYQDITTQGKESWIRDSYTQACS